MSAPELTDPGAPWRRWISRALGDERPAFDQPDEASEEPGEELGRAAVRLVAPLGRAACREIAERHGRDAARLVLPWLTGELAEQAVAAVAADVQAERAVSDDVDATALLRRFDLPAQRRAVLDGYPAMARALHDRAALISRSANELLARLARDRADLASLTGRPPGRAVAVEVLGDAHDGGRRVARLRFEDETAVVYKPRDATAETAYAALCQALTRAGLRSGLAAPRALARDGWMWQEHVEPAPCASAQELDAYFERLGAHLALLHALRAVDLHHENVIAAGEHPMLVDLETLLHPRLGGRRAGAVDPLIAETGMDCVLRVGLLPRSDVAFGVDIGAFGRDPESEIDIDVPEWVDEDGQVVLRNRPVRLRPGANVPTLSSGRPVRPHDHVDALADGFAAAYALLVELRERLLRPAGPLGMLSHAHVRVVLRPTKVYAGLLARQRTDLELLADDTARAAALTVLRRGARRRSDLGIAAEAEAHDLLAGDIPKVTAQPEAAHGLHHALGALPDMLAPHAPPGPACVTRLDDRDLERQLRFLRASVAEASVSAPVAGSPCSAEEAARILEIVALHDQDRVGWLAPVDATGHAGRVMRRIGPDARDGQAGIGLFLAELFARTRDKRWRTLALGAMRASDADPWVAEHVDALLASRSTGRPAETLDRIWTGGAGYRAAEVNPHHPGIIDRRRLGLAGAGLRALADAPRAAAAEPEGPAAASR